VTDFTLGVGRLDRRARAVPATPKIQRVFLSSCNSSPFTAFHRAYSCRKAQDECQSNQNCDLHGKNRLSSGAKVAHPRAKHGAALLPLVISKGSRF
jgi:hypothetical protein